MFSFNNRTIKAQLSHHGSVGNVVSACYETCEEPVAFVTYTTVGTDLLITSFSVHPAVSVKESQLAGDAIDAILEQEAQKLGLKRLLLIRPNNTVEEVRKYEIQPFLLRMDVRKDAAAYLNYI